MATKSLFPSVILNVDYVRTMADHARENGFEPALDKSSGYLLINGNLVPSSLVAKVAAQLACSTFDYGVVLSEAELFSDDFSTAFVKSLLKL